MEKINLRTITIFVICLLIVFPRALSRVVQVDNIKPLTAATSQSIQSRTAFLRKNNILEQATKLKAFVSEELRATYRDKIYENAKRLSMTDQEAAGIYDAYCDERAFYIAIHGFTLERVKALKDAGIDLTKATIPGPNLSMTDRATLAPLVLVGTIKDIIYSLEPGDGFRSTVIISVEEILKGESSSKDVSIRQFSGYSSSDKIIKVSHDFDTKDKGRSFLLFLSNPFYQYCASDENRDPIRENTRKPNSERIAETFFLNLYTPVRKDDSMLPTSKGRVNAEEVFKSIRNVARLMEQTQ